VNSLRQRQISLSNQTTLKGERVGDVLAKEFAGNAAWRGEPIAPGRLQLIDTGYLPHGLADMILAQRYLSNGDLDLSSSERFRDIFNYGKGGARPSASRTDIII